MKQAVLFKSIERLQGREDKIIAPIEREKGQQANSMVAVNKHAKKSRNRDALNMLRSIHHRRDSKSAGDGT